MSDTWATAGYDEKPAPNVFVQWKGTDACLDFRCVCGYDGHFDGLFAYNLRCSGCGRVWRMPHTIGLIDGDDGGAVQDTDSPHDRGRRESTEAAVTVLDPDEDRP